MAGAAKKSLWVTLQAHGNIIAVASLLDLSAVIITEGAIPDPLMIEKANEENVISLGTSKAQFLHHWLTLGNGFASQARRLIDSATRLKTFRSDLHVHTVLSP
jgi:hypothetical protein